jgi:hypothetical protein
MAPIKKHIGSCPSCRNSESLQLREVAQAYLTTRFNNTVGGTWADARNFEQLVARRSVNLDWFMQVAFCPGLLGCLVTRQ